MENLRLVREGMRIDINTPIKVRDGRSLMANIYFPMEEGAYPVVFNHGIYGKDLHYEDGYPDKYNRLRQYVPEYFTNTSCNHHCWEVIDPEKWCNDGYIIARVDSRGTGWSPGLMRPYAFQEAEDTYDLIEWFAAQPWCNGKVGLSGTSYHAVTMWNAAALNPPHLSAFVAWEGHTDIYRDTFRHGGILSITYPMWYKKQPMLVQHGRGTRGFTSRLTGRPVSGEETFSDDELRANRVDFGAMIASEENELINDFHRETMPDVSKITAPYIDIVNWGGQGLHLRGGVDAFVNGGSEHKYMYTVLGPHGDLYFGDFGVNLQKQFFGHFLKGENTGWDKMPSVRLRIPRVGEPAFSKNHIYRDEKEFPLARTVYTKYYLNCENFSLITEEPTATGSLSYKGISSDGLTFLTQPLNEETEITGYIMSRLFISSETEDVDLFLVVRAFSPDMKEVTFPWGANARHIPIAMGWQRASHRKMDPRKSSVYRPYLTHDELLPLKPGEIVEMNIEIWPSCIVLPKGFRLALTIRGKDYVYPGYEPAPNQPSSKFDADVTLLDGVGVIRHTDPVDRPPEIFDRNVTLHFDRDKRPYLLLPIIPQKKGEF